jgi:hypothetical protein
MDKSLFVILRNQNLAGRSFQFRILDETNLACPQEGLNKGSMMNLKALR